MHEYILSGGNSIPIKNNNSKYNYLGIKYDDNPILHKQFEIKLNKLINKSEKILKSKLSNYNKIKMIKMFILPQNNHFMRNNNYYL